jgi:SEC-C motif
MGMIGFHFLFPDEAANECRTVTPVGRADLPPRTFVFMEAYCVEPRCDCRRVMLNVIDTGTHDHVATVNYAFEPPKPPFDDEGQMFLDPLNPQGHLSPAFLELTADMLANDRAYHDRLVRHYTMWKNIVDDPAHPAHEKIRAVREDADSPPPEPVRRSGPKIGPNDPCPCGSARKYKKCCRG